MSPPGRKTFFAMIAKDQLIDSLLGNWCRIEMMGREMFHPSEGTFENFLKRTFGDAAFVKSASMDIPVTATDLFHYWDGNGSRLLAANGREIASDFVIGFTDDDVDTVQLYVIVP